MISSFFDKTWWNDAGSVAGLLAIDNEMEFPV